MAWVHVVGSSATGRDAARDLLRAEVAELTGAAVDQVVIGHECPRCGSSDHGRPVVLGASLHVSVGRTRGLTVVAVSDAPVGVDVEPAAAASFDGFDGVALHPDERASDDLERTRLWVRKEAVLKATGEGLRTDPRGLRVDTDRVVLADGVSAWVSDLDIDGYAVAVAVLADVEPTVSVRAASAAAGGAASP